MKRKFGLLGAGNLGTSIAFALKRIGMVFNGVYDIEEKVARRAAQILDCPVLNASTLAQKSDVLLFAVPDKEIAPLYGDLKPDISIDAIAVHFSGTLSSEVFTSHCGVSAHPAQTFPYPRTEDGAFRGVYFALEGATDAVEVFKSLLEDIGAKTFMLTLDHKPLYHAACVMASNLILGLLRTAVELAESIGIDKNTSGKIAGRLAFETCANAFNQNSLSTALSGPLARGDVETITNNINALKSSPGAQELYKLLSIKLLELAKEKGLGEREASSMLKILSK